MEKLLHTVVMRLGGLLVLMLTVGNWSDVLHVLVSFWGEAVCLLSSRDLLQAVLQVCLNHLHLLDTCPTAKVIPVFHDSLSG